MSVAAVFAAGAIGCSSNNTSKPTASDYDDVAQSLSVVVTAQGSGGETGSIAASASLASGVTPANVSVNAKGTFDSASAGLDYQFSVTCTDAKGQANACGPATDDASADVTWSGNLSLPNLTASVERSGQYTLTGVQSGTATFNGAGSFTFDSQFVSLFRNEQVKNHLSLSSSYSNVTFDESAKYVTGGTVHYTVDATRDAAGTSGTKDANFAIDAVLAFQADGSALLTLDGTAQYKVGASGVVVKI
ncbi:MAG TPA: hypothetical protein VGI39_07105 [Polyangiaceae bacterium]